MPTYFGTPFKNEGFAECEHVLGAQGYGQSLLEGFPIEFVWLKLIRIQGVSPRSLVLSFNQTLKVLYLSMYPMCRYGILKLRRYILL